jgi:hypothetical protein
VISIQYGQWSPDTANVAFQMPDQQGPVTVPVADCLNVYFQDGAYRVLPSLSSIGPALGYQSLNAFTWYDQVSQKETVFAAGANSISQLIDGSWNSVPISAGAQLLNTTLTAGVSGSNTGYSAGSYGSLGQTTDINNNTVGVISQNTTSGSAPVFTVTLDTANLGANYFASISFPGLNLSLPSSSATYSSTNSSTLLSATMAVGQSGDYTGFQASPLGPVIGTLSPTTDTNGNQVIGIAAFATTLPRPQYSFVLTIDTAGLGASYFNNLQIIPQGSTSGTTLLASTATYASGSGQSSWTWTTGAPITYGGVYSVLLVKATGSPTSTWTWSGTNVPMISGVGYNVVLTAPAASAENATFWSFAAMGPYLAAIPYTQSGQITGPYLWSNQGGGNNNFSRPQGAPGCRVGAIVSQFLMLGDLYQQQSQLLFTGNGTQSSYSGTLTGPMLANGTISDQQALLAGVFSNGTIATGGLLSQGTINYLTGALNLEFSSAVPNGDQVWAAYTQAAPYRVQWSGIGNVTNWPTPLTNAALAVQSGYNDLPATLGPVKFIAGYPLYGVIFQATGITRASYIGGNVVFSWQTYEWKRGLVAHGAAVQVGANTYFLADDGFYYTDGASVYPIGTASDNSAGIDNWFWANVNQSALEAIRAGYDAEKRCVIFAICTGSNTLPDTLLTYNVLSGKWTRAQVAVESLWTADNGTDGTQGIRQLLGLFDQTHTPNELTGSGLTGYLESADLAFSDGFTRFTPQVRPNIACMDMPLAVVGIRNSLESSITYSPAGTPDTFSAGFAPTLNNKGLYTRIRIISATATAINGATAKMRPGGPL